MNQKTVKRLRKATRILEKLGDGKKSGENKRLFRHIKKHYLSMNSDERRDFKGGARV
jgi:hypothetical protein